MDEFSLHQFIIRHGKVLSKTPEYESFKRTNSHNWGAILSVVRYVRQTSPLFCLQRVQSIPQGA